MVPNPVLYWLLIEKSLVPLKLTPLATTVPIEIVVELVPFRVKSDAGK